MNTPNPPEHANGNSRRLVSLNFKRILVPVDFSAGTIEALRYAKTLAEKFDAVIDVLSLARNEPNQTHFSEGRTQTKPTLRPIFFVRIPCLSRFAVAGR